MPSTARTAPLAHRTMRVTARPRRVAATALAAAVLQQRPVLVRASGATAAAAL